MGKASVSYFHDHTHSCACGGWRHEAVECPLPPEYPCPVCDIEEGLVPMATGSRLVEDPYPAPHFRLAYEGE